MFSTVKPELMGICHATCGYKFKPNIGHGFHMHPPDYLSKEQISFLMYFYPKLFSLPGGINEPNGELRRVVANMIYDFPETLLDPMIAFRNLMNENAQYPREWLYTGDLETDFLRVLGEIQKVAKKNPIGIEADFRKVV